MSTKADINNTLEEKEREIMSFDDLVLAEEYFPASWSQLGSTNSPHFQLGSYQMEMVSAEKTQKKNPPK